MRALGTAVLLPLLVLFAAVGGRTSLFRCQLTGMTSAEGCCPDQSLAAEPAPPSDARMTTAACCIRETAVSHVPSEPPSPAPHQLGAWLAGAASALAGLPAASGDRPRYAGDRFRPPQTSLFLAKRSLLI